MLTASKIKRENVGRLSVKGSSMVESVVWSCRCCRGVGDEDLAPPHPASAYLAEDTEGDTDVEAEGGGVTVPPGAEELSWK
jgi:hypothetical protein